MERLSSSDLGQALNFVREAGAVTGPDPFPLELLDALRALVPCEAVSWHEWSSDNGCYYSRSFSSSDPVHAAAVWEAYAEYRHQDPLPGGCPGAGPPPQIIVGRTLKFSDFLSRRQFYKLDLHAQVCRPLGINYVMKLFLPNQNGVCRGFVFDRSRRDFTERDRLMLDMLQPHFIALCNAAHNRRVLAALEESKDSPRCLIVLGRNGSFDFAGPDARELVVRYFGSGWERGLRQSLSVQGSPLTVERDGHCLVAHRVGDALVLHEDVGSLTPREREILDRVATGCSNSEVAADLHISPGTVRNHLEHAYRKLGVRSRTAALARLRGLTRPKAET
jgi:DNA-binding CsgD family transcriptional regulator